MSRTRLLGAAAALLCACAGEPARMYPGPALPPEQAVVLRDGPGVGVYAIDGERSFGDAWSLRPGERELWLRARVAGRNQEARYDAWTYCSVRLRAEPGKTYHTVLEKHERAHRGFGKELALDLRIVETPGDTQQYPRFCTGDRPDLDEPAPRLPLAALPEGPWGRGSGELACGANPHRIRFSEDERFLDFDYERPVRDRSGNAVRTIRYRVLGRSVRWIDLQLQGETQTDASGEPVRWQLVPLSGEAYCWHRADWARNACTEEIRRCD